MLTLLLAACSGETPVDDTGEPAASCSAGVVSTLPTDGATDHYYRQPIEFDLDDEVEAAEVTLTDADGNAVAGETTLEADGERVVFSPEGALVLGASYTATLSACGESTAISFTVSDAYGGAREGEVDGLTYAMHPTWGRIVEPAGADLIVQMLAPEPFRFQVSDAGTGTLDLRMGFTEDDAQDLCLPTFDLEGADFSADPWVHFGPAPAALAVPSGELVELAWMEFEGTFSSDLATVGGIRLAWEVDMRTLPPAMLEGLGGDPCSLLATIGTSCGECSSDGDPSCLVMRFDQITALQVEGASVEEVTEANCHEGCEASGSNPECDL